MNSVAQVLAELKRRGTAQTRKTYARHGISIPMFGVSIAELKVIAKQLRGQQTLALELFETGNYDAMYLAGMVANGRRMSKKQLEHWAKSSDCAVLCGYTVPAVACESLFAQELAVKWIRGKSALGAICGWGTYGGIVAITPDDDLDLDEIAGLLERIGGAIEKAPDRVRYAMNQFVIAVGVYVKPLASKAKRIAKAIGVVPVDMGDTACKVPVALAYIEKVESMGRIGKKRKTMRC